MNSKYFMMCEALNSASEDSVNEDCVSEGPFAGFGSGMSDAVKKAMAAKKGAMAAAAPKFVPGASLKPAQKLGFKNMSFEEVENS